MQMGQVIVDTSNEIGGDGNIPHAAIGGARRMQVPEPSMQHRVMVEAVENHMPEVIIVDEIGTEAEAHACRSIAERGIMLIGTAHGQQLENIMKNPTLSDLVRLDLHIIMPITSKSFFSCCSHFKKLNSLASLNRLSDIHFGLSTSFLDVRMRLTYIGFYVVIKSVCCFLEHQKAFKEKLS